MITYTNSQISHVIDEYIHNERDRKILKRRFVDGIIFDQLAEEFDLSVRQVKNIVYKSEKIFLKHLKWLQKNAQDDPWIFVHFFDVQSTTIVV